MAGSPGELPACENGRMESNTIWLLVAAMCAVGGFGLAHLWNRSRPSHDEKRVAELEAELSVAREERARQVQELRESLRGREEAAARLQAEVAQLRERAAELATRLEEKRRLVNEARAALEASFKSLSADALKNNNQSFLDLARASLAEFQQAAKG